MRCNELAFVSRLKMQRKMSWHVCSCWMKWNEMRASRSVFVRVPAKTTTPTQLPFLSRRERRLLHSTLIQKKRTKATHRGLSHNFPSPSRHPPPSSLPTFLPRLSVCVLSMFFPFFLFTLPPRPRFRTDFYFHCGCDQEWPKPGPNMPARFPHGLLCHTRQHP